MERVVVTRCLFNIATMQTCAVMDATDDEILAVCNRDNPSGTSLGWARVIRASDGEDSMFAGPNTVPVPCADDPARLHFLVVC